MHGKIDSLTIFSDVQKEPYKDSLKQLDQFNKVLIVLVDQLKKKHFPEKMNYKNINLPGLFCRELSAVSLNSEILCQLALDFNTYCKYHSRTVFTENKEMRPEFQDILHQIKDLYVDVATRVLTGDDYKPNISIILTEAEQAKMQIIISSMKKLNINTTNLENVDEHLKILARAFRDYEKNDWEFFGTSMEAFTLIEESLESSKEMSKLFAKIGKGLIFGDQNSVIATLLFEKILINGFNYNYDNAKSQLYQHLTEIYSQETVDNLLSNTAQLSDTMISCYDVEQSLAQHKLVNPIRKE